MCRREASSRILGSFWNDLGVVFGIWINFGVVLASFCNDFRIVLAETAGNHSLGQNGRAPLRTSKNGSDRAGRPVGRLVAENPTWPRVGEPEAGLPGTPSDEY